MATVRIADMFANIVKQLDAARSSLTDAAGWARSDWSDQRPLTEAEAEARYAVFGVVQQAKDAIDDVKGLIGWAQRDPRTRRRRPRSGVSDRG